MLNHKPFNAHSEIRVNLLASQASLFDVKITISGFS